MAAFAVLAALHHQRRTGESQWIEFCQAENMLAQIGEAFLDYSMNDRSPEPHGNRHPTYVQGAYPCKGWPDADNLIALTIEDDEQWDSLKDLMGNPKGSEDERLDTRVSIRENQDVFDEHFSNWVINWDKYELFHILQDRGIPASPILSEEDAYEDPHVEERGFF